MLLETTEPVRPETTRSARRKATEELGRVLRHARLLRRYLRLLDEAEHRGIELITASDVAADRKAGGR